MQQTRKSQPIPSSLASEIFRCSVTVLAMLALPLFSVPSSRAQEGSGDQDSPEGVFFDVTHINVVNVDVYVTDKKGNRVTDLTADDFVVRENGEPMEVTNFYAVANGRPQATASAVGEGGSRGEAGRGDLRLSEIEVPEEQRLHLIIYVDNYNLHPSTRNRTLARMHRFVSQSVGREDRVMVVSYDQSLKVRQPFTGDIDLATNALLDLEELAGGAVNRDAERRRYLEEIEEAEDERQALLRARSFADSVWTEMNFNLRGLEQQISALSGLKGRKALLYVTDGIPMVVGEDLFFFVEENFERSTARMEAQAYDLTGRFRELVAKANANNITFYTVDAGGLQAHESISAEYGGTASGGSLIYIDTIRNANLQEPLHLIADDTGGMAITNTNAIEANLANVVKDFRNYYSLGYQAPHNGDGRYYKIEVKTKNKAYKVRHRNGYRDKTPEARLTDGAVATLYFGSESNPLGIKTSFERPTLDGRHYLLPMSLEIPLGQIALAPQEGFFIGRVKVSVVVMDEDGGTSPVQQQEPLSLRIPAAEIEEARGKSIFYDVGLAVRSGFSRIAIGVRDELSSEMTFLRESINIGS